MAAKLSSMTDELTALRAEKSQMEASCEEVAKCKDQIDAMTKRIASLVSSSEEAKAELDKVTHLCLLVETRSFNPAMGLYDQ